MWVGFRRQELRILIRFLTVKTLALHVNVSSAFKMIAGRLQGEEERVTN